MCNPQTTVAERRNRAKRLGHARPTWIGLGPRGLLHGHLDPGELNLPNIDVLPGVL